MTNTTSLYRVILILASCLSAHNLSAQFVNSIVKMWETGPLTWNDFQVRHVPDNSLYYSDLSACINGKYERKRDGNLVYYNYTVINEMYISSSWYDPDKCTDWTLRYEQTRFDIMEVFRRIIQNQYYHDQLVTQIRHENIIPLSEAIITFDRESKYGTDTLVIEKYEREYRKKLDSIAFKPLPGPIVRTKKWGLGFTAGPDMMFYLTNVPENLTFSYGFGLGMDINIKKWLVGLDVSYGYAGALESDNFYYDPEYDYSWKKGRRVSTIKPSFTFGYKILDNNRWTVMPMIGIGGNVFEQETDTPIGDGNSGYKTSTISGTRVLAGINLDWKIRRYLTAFSKMYQESKIRLQITGARTGFDIIGDSYSINFKLLYAFDMWDLL
ncbi:MAG: hypothetical protein IKJ66_08515 [Bacteroidaceae bacterium]|nr:hypothetical protein [Bacteroidaceae bacterium]